MTTFDTHIDGIECQCEVTHYRPEIPANCFAPMEMREEAIPSEFEFKILDRCGNPAPTLQAIATQADIERLQDEFEAAFTAHKHGKDF